MVYQTRGSVTKPKIGALPCIVLFCLVIYCTALYYFVLHRLICIRWQTRGSIAAAQKNCRDWIKQAIVFYCRLVLLFCFYCFSFYCINPIGLDLLRAATRPTDYLVFHWIQYCNLLYCIAYGDIALDVELHCVTLRYFAMWCVLLPFIALPFIGIHCIILYYITYFIALHSPWQHSCRFFS